MNEIIAGILQQQLSSGFPDLAGSHVSATIPVSERLINEIIAKTLPPAGAVQDVQLEALEGNQIKVRLRAWAGPLNLPMTVTLAIDEQPALPHRPVLGLRLAGVPLLLSMAGPVARFLDVLPKGITLDGDRISVNLQTLLAQHNQGDLVRYLTELRVTTAAGAVIVALRARVPA